MNIVSGFTLQLILEKQLAFKYWHSIKQEYTDYLKRLLKYFSFFQIHIIHEAKIFFIYFNENNLLQETEITIRKSISY